MIGAVAPCSEPCRCRRTISPRWKPALRAQRRFQCSACTLRDGVAPDLSRAITMPDPLVQITELTKDYNALRPLRLRDLEVAPGELLALLGLDAPAAELFVNLVTGATLPDAGAVRVFGVDTAAITDADEWLRTLDRVGILSDRAVLLEELTVAQNLAMTFTLAIDPIPVDVRNTVESLAREVGL